MVPGCKMKKNKTDWFQRITLIAIIITASGSVWTAHETRVLAHETLRLVDYQVREDVYFDVSSHIVFPRSYNKETQILSMNSFKEADALDIEIINRGFKTIKVKDLILTGDCVDNRRISIIDQGFSLQEGEEMKEETVLIGRFISSNTTCEMNYILVTDTGNCEDNIILEVN